MGRAEKSRGGARGTGCVRSAAGVRDAVRDAIIAGRHAPGDQLPTHVELADHFGVSNVTIQNALNQLAGDGFIEIRPRVGSFVADSPPHEQNIALVFPFDPDTSGEHWNWSKYYQALANAARQCKDRVNRRFVQFHRIDYHTDSEDYRRLLRYIDRRQLAGIVFAGPPYMVEDTPVCQAPGLPRVELSSAQEASWPVINLRGQQWYEKALDHLAEKGRHRVAILLNRFTQNVFYDEANWDRMLAEREMISPSHWRQAAEWHDSRAANHMVQLLMERPEGQRPDALLITDDNLLEGVTAGLVTSGVSVPNDVEVVARANFPLPAAPTLPVRLLGYDLVGILCKAVELIDQQREAEKPTAVMEAPVLWREERSRPQEVSRHRTAARFQKAAVGGS